MTTREAVGMVNLFSGLSGDMLDRLANIATLAAYGKDRIIFLEGQAADGFYAVASGNVKIYKTSPSGREQILHLFGPGEAFGEAAVFAGVGYPASAMALEPSRTLFIQRAAFGRLIQREPELAMSMLGLLSMRLRQFANQIESLSLKEVPSRLAAHLLLLRESQGADAVRLNLSKTTLASYLGTIPETMSRILRRMTDDGLVAVEGGVVRLLNVAALEALAAGGAN